MKPISILPDDSLRFHARDAYAAVSALPQGHKAAQYLEEAHACERELIRRETIRLHRAAVARVFDPLSEPRRGRKFYRSFTLGSTRWRRDGWPAAHALAFFRVCRPQ